VADCGYVFPPPLRIKPNCTACQEPTESLHYICPLGPFQFLPQRRPLTDTWFGKNFRRVFFQPSVSSPDTFSLKRVALPSLLRVFFSPQDRMSICPTDLAPPPPPPRNFFFLNPSLLSLLCEEMHSIFGFLRDPFLLRGKHPFLLGFSQRQALFLRALVRPVQGVVSTDPENFSPHSRFYWIAPFDDSVCSSKRPVFFSILLGISVLDLFKALPGRRFPSANFLSESRMILSSYAPSFQRSEATSEGEGPPPLFPMGRLGFDFPRGTLGPGPVSEP